MYCCPHCNKETIRFHRKWWSSSASPTRCLECDGMSYIPTAIATSIMVGAIVWLILSGLVSALLNSSLPLIGGAVGAIAIYGYFWSKVVLVATHEAAATRTRRTHSSYNLLAWLLWLFH